MAFTTCGVKHIPNRGPGATELLRNLTLTRSLLVEGRHTRKGGDGVRLQGPGAEALPVDRYAPLARTLDFTRRLAVIPRRFLLLAPALVMVDPHDFCFVHYALAFEGFSECAML